MYFGPHKYYRDLVFLLLLVGCVIFHIVCNTCRGHFMMIFRPCKYYRHLVFLLAVLYVFLFCDM
jgi:hypothetical protein